MKTPSEEEEGPCLRVEIPEAKEGENPWAQLTRFFERFLGHMETHVWPFDPLADVHPTLLPFKYVTPDDKQDPKFEKELAYLLTIGLQGQAFAWKYKMAFDLYWNTALKAYQVELTSVRRVDHRTAEGTHSTLTPQPPRSE